MAQPGEAELHAFHTRA